MREGRLRWYEHFMKRDQEHIGRRVIEMELLGKRKRERPKRRFLDVVKKDMGKAGAREMDIESRTLWRNIICCGTPDQRERPIEEDKLGLYKNTHQI